MRTTFALFVAAFLACPSDVSAQSTTDRTHDSSLDRTAIHRGLSAEGIRAAIARIPPPPVDRSDAISTSQSTSARPSWPKRHPVLLGTIIGGGVGAILGGGRRVNTTIAVLVGAGAGALGTALMSTTHDATATYNDPSNGSSSGQAGAAVSDRVSRLGIGRRILVTTSDGVRHEGRILAIRADRFVVASSDGSAPLDISYRDVKTLRAKVGNGRKAALVAGVIGGVVVGWLACYGAGGCGGVS